MMGYRYKGAHLCHACGDMIRRRVMTKRLISINKENEDKWPSGPYDYGEMTADKPLYCQRWNICERAIIIQLDEKGSTMRFGAWLGNKLTNIGIRHLLQSPSIILTHLEMFWYHKALIAYNLSEDS